MFNSELEIGRKVKVGDWLRGDRKATITALTDVYEIPSNGMNPELCADRWVVVTFEDGTTTRGMAGMLEAL